MKLTENECSEALTRLLRPYFAKIDVQNVYHSINKGHSIEEDSNLLTLLIQEYFGNPPLKYEELKEGMFVWDNKHHTYILIDRIWETYNKTIYFYAIGWECCENMEFEENRFYRKEVTQ